MKKIAQLARKFVSDEKGLETVEYAVIAGLITVAVITIIGSIGGKVKTIFSDLDTALTPPQ